MTLVHVPHIPGMGTTRRFVRYCLVGGVNTLMSVLILTSLLWRFPTHDARLLVVENAVAYAGGAVSSFFLNKYWTFQRRQRPTRREAGRFLLSVALGLALSNGLLWLAGMALSPFLVNVTAWGTASKLLADAANAVLSYLIMRFWIFGCALPPRRDRRAPISPAASGPTRDAPPPQKMAEPGVKETSAGAGLSVILPAFNEEAVIADTMAEVLATLPTWTSDFEVIVVNDGSQDATAALLEGIAAAHRQVRVLHHRVNQGYGVALVTGFEASTKDLVFLWTRMGNLLFAIWNASFPGCRSTTPCWATGSIGRTPGYASSMPGVGRCW